MPLHNDYINSRHYNVVIVLTMAKHTYICTSVAIVVFSSAKETIITVCHWTFARPNGMFVRQ